MKILNILKFAVVGSIFCGSLIAKDSDIKGIEDMGLREVVESFLSTETFKGRNAHHHKDDHPHHHHKHGQKIVDPEVKQIIDDFVKLSSENFIIFLTEGYKKAPGMTEDGREISLIDFLYELEFSGRVKDFQFYGSNWGDFKKDHVQEANLCLELLRMRPDLLINPEIQELIRVSFVEDSYKECGDLSNFDKSRIDEIRVDMQMLANNPFSLLAKAYPGNPEFRKMTIPYAIPQTIVDFFIKISSALGKESLKSRVEEALAQRDAEVIEEQETLIVDEAEVGENETLVEEVIVEEIGEDEVLVDVQNEAQEEVVVDEIVS